MQGPYPNRLQEVMRIAGKNDPQLAELAGTTKQQIFKLRRGDRKLTVQWAQRLAPHLNVAWQELIEGPSDPLERELVTVFRSADTQGRDMLLRLARSLGRESAAESEHGTPPQAVPMRPKGGPKPSRPTRVGGLNENLVASGDCGVVRLPAASQARGRER